MSIKNLPISDIHESEYNPRVALDRSSKEYLTIKKSIEEYGLVEPIVVNDVNMCCIGGHQRLAVLRDIGEKTIDCSMVHIDCPEKEKALCIALNKIKGDWDADKLDELLSDDEVREFEMGFEELDIQFDDELPDDVDSDDKIEDSYLYNDEDFDFNEDEIPESNLTVKIGGFHFKITTPEYENLIGSLRDSGIFDKTAVCDELRRKICSD